MAWEKLNIEELRLNCKPKEITFKTTAEIPPLEGMICRYRSARS